MPTPMAFPACVPVAAAVRTTVVDAKKHRKYDTMQTFFTLSHPARVRHVALALTLAAILTAALFLAGCAGEDHSEHESPEVGPSAAPDTAQVWTCPMHPEVRESEPGKCPLCQMDLVAESDANGGQ